MWITRAGGLCGRPTQPPRFRPPLSVGHAIWTPHLRCPRCWSTARAAIGPAAALVGRASGRRRGPGALRARGVGRRAGQGRRRPGRPTQPPAVGVGSQPLQLRRLRRPGPARGGPRPAGGPGRPRGRRWRPGWRVTVARCAPGRWRHSLAGPPVRSVHPGWHQGWELDRTGWSLGLGGLEPLGRAARTWPGGVPRSRPAAQKVGVAGEGGATT